VLFLGEIVEGIQDPEVDPYFSNCIAAMHAPPGSQVKSLLFNSSYKEYFSQRRQARKEARSFVLLTKTY